jgi:hypothetical protein
LNKEGEPEIIQEVVSALTGKRCWYASCGGINLPTFSLAFGDKIPRKHVLKNSMHTDEFRNFEGEANLYVWCTWRLDDPTRGPLTSSDDTADHIVPQLDGLAGLDVCVVNVERPGWDLQLLFSGDRKLNVFCDHVPGNPSFDGNWELVLKDWAIEVGVGSQCKIEAR